MHDNRLYLLSGGGERSDWVRNLIANPGVEVRIADRSFRAEARVLSDDAPGVRRAMAAKYQRWREGMPLSDWAASALLVELTAP